MKEFKGSPALDSALIAAAQAVEHYEISRYGTLKSWAEDLDCLRRLHFSGKPSRRRRRRMLRCPRSLNRQSTFRAPGRGIDAFRMAAATRPCRIGERTSTHEGTKCRTGILIVEPVSLQASDGKLRRHEEARTKALSGSAPCARQGGRYCSGSTRSLGLYVGVCRPRRGLCQARNFRSIPSLIA